MFTRTRQLLAAMSAAIALAVGATATVDAQPQQDGLVNIFINDVLSHNEVQVAAVAGIVAQVCGVNVKLPAVAILGQAIAVDRSGRSRTICETAQGPVEIRQNQ